MFLLNIASLLNVRNHPIFGMINFLYSLRLAMVIITDHWIVGWKNATNLTGNTCNGSSGKMLTRMECTESEICYNVIQSGSDARQCLFDHFRQPLNKH